MSHTALDPEAVAALLDSVGGDREFLGELFATFRDEAPTLLGSIEAAVAAGNAEALRHAAHTLKSTSASLGALTLSELSKQLEQAGRDGDAASAAAHLEPLRDLVVEALAAMASVAEGT